MGISVHAVGKLEKSPGINDTAMTDGFSFDDELEGNILVRM